MSHSPSCISCYCYQDTMCLHSRGRCRRLTSGIVTGELSTSCRLSVSWHVGLVLRHHRITVVVGLSTSWWLWTGASLVPCHQVALTGGLQTSWWRLVPVTGRWLPVVSSWLRTGVEVAKRQQFWHFRTRRVFTIHSSAHTYTHVTHTYKASRNISCGKP